MSKADSTRDKILDAALNIFATKGYHDTRMDEIVTESDTSKGAIYFHFPNKERLFLALVDQFADLLERRVVDAVEDQGEGMGRVKAALQACLDTFGRYRRPAKILLVQAVGLGNLFEKKRVEVNDRFALLIKRYLDEAVAIGELDPVDTEVVAFAWMGAIYGIVIRWVYTGEPESERILTSLLPMLLKSVGYDGSKALHTATDTAKGTEETR
ncbi:MAG: TetR/AcrR family transcriptional regulator [Chloroflexota bacterium]|nr:TetR/AcrR family transcriptional regulator [Chloroflexota bacterium]